MIAPSKLLTFRRIGSAYFLCFVLLLVGCGTTPYQKDGTGYVTGGYKDVKIDDNTYEVSFYGNASTGSEQVWNLWMHRCAELTLEKGYAYFSMEPKKRIAENDHDPRMRPAMLLVDSEDNKKGAFIQTKGGGTTYYYYSVPQTYTVWSSSATIKLYREPLPTSVPMALDAAKLKSFLAPTLTGKPRDLPRMELIGKAAVYGNKLFAVLAPTDAPVVNNMNELRTYAEREYTPSSLPPDIASSLAPLAGKFAARKHQILAMTAEKQRFLNAGDDKPQTSSMMSAQYIHHPNGYSTVITRTFSTNVSTPGNLFGATLDVGGIFRAKSSYTIALNKLTLLELQSMADLQGTPQQPKGGFRFVAQRIATPLDEGLTAAAAPMTPQFSLACTVGETKLASQLHAKLSGNAIAVTCQREGGKIKQRNKFWFLEDYLWYLADYEESAGNLTRYVLRDINVSP